MTLARPIPIDLSAAILSQIQEHGIATYPHEACGVLIGTDDATSRTIKRAIPVNNTWHTPQDRTKCFTLDPAEQLRIERSLDGTDAQIVGFYHTHPDHPAAPSAFDLEAAWGFYSYLIVRIDRDRAAETRCWLLDDGVGRFVEQKIDQ
jgi:proteasome lid subunit RPN8/RPN11